MSHHLDRITLEDMDLPCRIGVAPGEAEFTQPLRVRLTVGLDLDESVVDIRSIFEQLTTDGNRDDVALSNAESTVDLDVQVHREVRTDISGAHRMRSFHTINL